MSNLKISISLVAILFSFGANSQELKSTWGFGLHLQGYTDYAHRKDIPVDNIKRFSGAGTIDYQRFLKKNLTYTISLEFNSRKTSLPSNSKNGNQLYQSFMALPIGFGFVQEINRENKNAVKKHIASCMAGGYIESLMQQGMADSSQSYYNLKDKYFDYYRYGFYIEASISILPKTSGYSGHTFGFQARWNPNGAAFGESGSVVQQSGYTIGTVFYRYLIDVNFRK